MDIRANKQRIGPSRLPLNKYLPVQGTRPSYSYLRFLAKRVLSVHTYQPLRYDQQLQQFPPSHIFAAYDKPTKAFPPP